MASAAAEVVEIILGQEGLDSVENQFLIKAEDLILAEGITQENQLIQKEAGASVYNVSGIALGNSPTLTGDWSNALAWNGAVATFRTSELSPFVKVIGTSNSPAT